MSNDESNESGPAERKPGMNAPYETVLRELAQRIQNEPFLFVVAIGVLLLALGMLAAASRELRLIVVVLAGLALVVIAGYYARQIWDDRQKRQITGQMHSTSQLVVDVPAESRRYWQQFTDGRFLVVVGRVNEFQQFEPSGLIGVGSASALMDLRSFLTRLALPDFDVAYADHMDGEALRHNLIAIGGPDSNSITKEIVRRTNGTLIFGNASAHDISFEDALSGTTYVPRMQPRSRSVELDYAVIIGRSNPFAPDKRVLVIAGSFGYGTWGAARFVMSKRFTANPLVSKKKEFECLIEVDVLKETPQDTRVVTMRQLDIRRTSGQSVLISTTDTIANLADDQACTVLENLVAHRIRRYGGHDTFWELTRRLRDALGRAEMQRFAQSQCEQIVTGYVAEQKGAGYLARNTLMYLAERGELDRNRIADATQEIQRSRGDSFGGPGALSLLVLFALHPDVELAENADGRWHLDLRSGPEEGSTLFKVLGALVRWEYRLH